MEERFQVGVITSTHGIKGEVKVFPTTDDPARFKKKMELILETGKEERILIVESVKFFKQFAILKFSGIDDINDIECYKGKPLFVTRKNAVPLKQDEYYIADLLGMEVYEDTDVRLGVLRDVLETGANDVYDITLENGTSLLLPAIKECILEINVEERRMTVHVMEGLR
ncbi:MAG: ribosome maturation factor RimM [Lachnospiraceae bacterium]|nr:ribosome maturation factor RimM [Lachnospiraceae bacterium]MDD7027860.1 ribosome maturation factor RimM [Lachnospiraceae bacterium]MDY5701501.1 ribosome maturation factor RimM [Lachnospiraceae bacterium]